MASHFKTDGEPAGTGWPHNQPERDASDNLEPVYIDLLVPEDTTGDEEHLDLKPGEVFGLHKKRHSRRDHRTRHASRMQRLKPRHHHRHHRHRRGHRRHRRIWPKVLVVLLVLMVAAGVEGFFLYRSARLARVKAQEAVAGATEYLRAARSGDGEKLKTASVTLSDSAHALNGELSQPQWVVASFVPVVGSDVRSVRTLGGVLVDMCDEALTPLAEESDILSLSELMQDSAVNLDALKHVTKAAEQAAPVVARAAEAVEDMPPAHISQVGTVIEQARGAILDANNVMTHGEPLLSHLPKLLGNNGRERQYMVLATNIAEVHAVGGFVGFVGKLKVKDGHIELSDFENLGALLPYSKDTGATKEEVELFGDRANTHSGDHNVIPDYSRAGLLYYNHWMEAQQEKLDGVLSFDTMFLQRVLGLVGGVETSQGVTVDGTNACKFTLNECLFKWDSNTVDDFYREVADKALDKFLGNLGSVDLPRFLQVMAQSADEGRCIGWIHNKDIQEAMVKAGFAWELPHDATKPMLGVFMNDYLASKCSYYMSIDTNVGEPRQNPDGSKTYAVTTTFKYNAPRSMIDQPRHGYLIPNSSEKDGTFLRLGEEVCLVAPEGGKIENVQTTYSNLLKGQRSIDWYQTSYQGLGMWKCDMHIDVSEVCDVTYEVTTSPEAAEELVVRQTPVVPHEVRGD